MNVITLFYCYAFTFLRNVRGIYWIRNWIVKGIKQFSVSYFVAMFVAILCSYTLYIFIYLSTDHVCEVGAMTEVILLSADRKNKYYCIYCQDMYLLPKEKLNCLNSHKVRIGKSWWWEKMASLWICSVAMASLTTSSQWFPLLPSLKITNEATIFPEDGLYQKI